MAGRNNPIDNNNNRNNPNIREVSPNDTQDTFIKKQLKDYDKEKRKIDEAIERDMSKYRVALYLSENNLSFNEQRKLVKKLGDFKKKQEEKKLKDEFNQFKKQAEREEKYKEELSALARKKEQEEEKQFQKQVLEGKLAKYQEVLNDQNASFKDKAKALMGALKSQKTEDEKREESSKRIAALVDKANSTMKATMDAYSKYQSTINTRLQGTSKTFSSLQNSLLTNVGITPYIKTQVMLDNLQKLVETGIAFNLEQRAFLSTVSDKVASTFNAFDSNLLRIVKLQQADSTASRLGMEAYLTKFLNNMFSNTEYLSGAFDTVTGNLVEATSQMSLQMGVQFEYVVQKWLGSLSSVGLSDTTVGNIAQAMGYLATGNVQGLESSGMQNLVVMAASRAGLSYADMLTRGINLDETNKLLGSMVEYLQQIGSSTNQVVKNQYASTFGVSISDLRAAGNLNSNDVKIIGDTLLSYGGAMGELNTQLNTIGQRMSLAEKLSNISDNASFSMFSNIADNPALYALWTVTDMIQSYTGGINIPSVLGTGPNTTIENLMKLGIMGIGSLGMIGDIVNGIGNTMNFSNAFAKLGGGSLVTTSRGSGIANSDSGFWDSESTYIGQSGGSDYYKGTLAASKQDVQNQITNNETAGSDVDMKKDIADVLLALHNNVASILNLMKTGVPVSVNNFGLTTGTNI